MYVLLCGYPPFFGDSDAEVMSRVRLGNFSFNGSDWGKVSEDAKKLIRALLKMNPRDRYTAQTALDDEWIVGIAPNASAEGLDALVENMRHFHAHNKFKRLAIALIADRMDEMHIRSLRNTFLALDTNGDGFLSLAELKAGMDGKGLAEDAGPDFRALMSAIDADGSGQIDYTEFLAATCHQRQYLEEAAVWDAFRFFDKDGNGKISKAELKQVMNTDAVSRVISSRLVPTSPTSGEDPPQPPPPQREVSKLMEEVDQDGDGEIDFAEFMQMMRQDC